MPPNSHEPEETMNAADYVDALLRPRSDRVVVAQEKIQGRRMRDRYVGEVTVRHIVESQD